MKSVVIVGVAPRSFAWTPDDEVWVMNSAGRRYSPNLWHRWFHLHGSQHILDACGPRELEMLTDLAKDKKVYTPRGGGGTLAFPYAEVIRSCGFDPAPLLPHFHNSFPLMIAFAVLEGATSITLDGARFGFDGPGEEWAIPAIEWHLGRAAGKGIEVRVPSDSGILEPHRIYGLAGAGSI